MLKTICNRLECLVCGKKACTENTNAICIGLGCRCYSRCGGSPMCLTCWQRQKDKLKYGIQIYYNCRVCLKYIKWSSKRPLSFFRKGILANKLCIVKSAFFAQSSRPIHLPMPHKWFSGKNIDRRLKCLSITRKICFKLMGISCNTYSFKMGYSKPEFANIDCGFFLRFIIKRFLARFYML